MQKSIVTILFFILVNCCAAQQQFVISYIKNNDQLKSNYVTDIDKKNGKLLFTTKKGLIEYDGYQFIPHQYISKEVKNFCCSPTTIFYEQSGVGLCSTNSLFDTTTVLAKVNYFNSTPTDDNFEHICYDNQNLIFSTFDTSISVVDYKTKSQLNFSFTKANLHPLKCKLVNGEMLLFGAKNLYIYDNTSNQFKLSNFNLSATIIDGIYLNETSTIVLLTANNELLFYDSKANKLSNKNLPSIAASTSNIQFAKTQRFNSNNVLLFSSFKIYSYNIGLNQLDTIYTSKSKINQVFYDDETQLIWAATESGIVKLEKIDDIVKTITYNDLAKKFTHITADENNNIWLCNQSNILYKYNIDSRIWNTFTLSNNQHIFSTTINTSNDVFVATSIGLMQVGVNSKLILKNNLPCKKIVFSGTQNCYVITQNQTVQMLNSSFFIMPNAIKNDTTFWKNNHINDILVDSNNNVWLAAWSPKGYGILRLNKNSNLFEDISTPKFANKSENFVSDYYNNIALATHQQLLFSAYGGYNLIDSNSKITGSFFSDKNNIDNVHFAGIAQLGSHLIVTATDDGLYIINALANKTTRLSTTDYLLEDNIVAGFCKKDSHIILGYNNAFQILNINKILQPHFLNKLILSKLVVDNKLYSPTNKIEVDYTHSQIELFFSTLTYSSPHKIIYRYKINSDTAWVLMNADPKLSFIKLASGTYNIVVQAGDNLGNWQAQKLEIQLVVKPPFYKAAWFIALLILLTLLLFYFVNKYFVKQEKYRQELLRKIDDSEMETLRSRMNPHFLFNSLNSINRFIIEQKTKEATTYLTTFSKLMRSILENSQQNSVTISSEVNALKMYLSLEQVRLEHRFNYNIFIDDSIDEETEKIPPLIIQPFAENAIWHGFQNIEYLGNINISISKKDNYLQIAIADDGVGRAFTASIKKEQTKHKSFGIDITKNRLKLLNPANSIEVIDRYKEDKTPNGTTVIIKIFDND